MSGVKTKLQAFLISVPDGDELSDSTPIPFIPGQIPPALTGWLRCRVGRRTSLTRLRTSNYSANTVRVRWSQRWCCSFESWLMLSRLDPKLPTVLRHYDSSKLRQTIEQSIWCAIPEYLTILWSGQSRRRAIREDVESVKNSHTILVGKIEYLEDTGANG